MRLTKIKPNTLLVRNGGRVNTTFDLLPTTRVCKFIVRNVPYRQTVPVMGSSLDNVVLLEDFPNPVDEPTANSSTIHTKDSHSATRTVQEEESSSRKPPSDGNNNNNINDDDKNNNNNNAIPPECQFSMGDHVYQWCSVAFIPGIYQHHGIVLDVVDYDCNDQEWILKIVDFSNERNQKIRKSKKPQQSRLVHVQSSFHPNGGGVVRTYLSAASEWSAVQYSATLWQRATWRAGTCTAVRTDPPGLVRARAQHLLEHPEGLPRYDAISANCECFAVWCKTGTFATLQTSSWLAMTSAGQIKSAVTVGSVAAATQVTVPSAGLWGWLGYTTHVSLLTAQPMLLPAIATYGVVTAGVPAIVLAMAKQHWKTTTVTLNNAFWEQAVAQPEVFVECITYWSSAHDPISADVQELKTIHSEELIVPLSPDQTTEHCNHGEAEATASDNDEAANAATCAVEKDYENQLADGHQSSGQTSSEPQLVTARCK